MDLFGKIAIGIGALVVIMGVIRIATGDPEGKAKGAGNIVSGLTIAGVGVAMAFFM